MPMAFAEQGVTMLSSALNSPTAIKVNIQIIRVFTKIRAMLTDTLSMKLEIEEIKKKLSSLLFSAPLCSAVHPSPLPSPPLHLFSLFYCISSNLTQLSPHQLSSTLVHHSLHHPSCLLCTPSKIN